jgi:hypothetical protein
MPLGFRCLCNRDPGAEQMDESGDRGVLAVLLAAFRVHHVCRGWGGY